MSFVEENKQILVAGPTHKQETATSGIDNLVYDT